MSLAVAFASVRSAVGCSASSYAAAVRAQITRIRAHPRFLDSSHHPVYAGYDPELPNLAPSRERIRALAVAALNPVARFVDDAQLVVESVILCRPTKKPDFGDADIEELATQLRIRSNWPTASWTKASGQAAGVEAIATCFARQGGRAKKVCVVVGADSHLSRASIDSLESDERIMVTGATSGFYPGEAAGAVVLGAPTISTLSKLRVTAAAVTQEERAFHQSEPSLGVALGKAIEKVLQGRGQTNFIVNDANGERYRAEEWSMATLRCRDDIDGQPVVMFPAAATGDVGAAYIPLGLALVAQGHERGWIRSSPILLTASSDPGERGALALEVVV